jgi:hypothetical protein
MGIPGSARKAKLPPPSPGAIVRNKRKRKERDALTAECRAARARTGALVREIRVLSRRQAVWAREFQDRLVNTVGWIASLLVWQSRAVAAPEAAAHLATVARRVAEFGHVHRPQPLVDGGAAGEASAHSRDVLPYVSERLPISPGKAAGSSFPISPEQPENEP